MYITASCTFLSSPLATEHLLLSSFRVLLSPLFRRGFFSLFLFVYPTSEIYHSTTISLSGDATRLLRVLYLLGNNLAERFYCVRPPDLSGSASRSIGIHIRMSKWRDNIFYPWAKALSRYILEVRTSLIRIFDLLSLEPLQPTLSIRFSQFTVGLAWKFAANSIKFSIDENRMRN